MTAQLSVSNISHRYGNKVTFTGLSLSLQQGEIGCLLGPSGCGKTTALRCIAGFEPITAGEIYLHNRILASPGQSVPAHQRRVGMVFQDFALFPHLNVYDNIAFGLHRAPAAQRKQRVAELLEVIGLQHLGLAYPHELSGGQQQRVALARALAPQPELLLLDEPFSNLDSEMRERLGTEVRNILKQQNTTAILVTHDQHEAFAMADHIGLLHQGKLQQWDNAYQLYHEPRNRFVAGFIGEGVWVTGQALDERRISTELGIVQTRTAQSSPPGSAVHVLIRPDDILHDDASPHKATVVNKAFRGAEFLYTLALSPHTQVLSLVPSHHNHAVGEPIGIRLDIEHVVAFHAEEKGGIPDLIRDDSQEPRENG